MNKSKVVWSVVLGLGLGVGNMALAAGAVANLRTSPAASSAEKTVAPPSTPVVVPSTLAPDEHLASFKLGESHPFYRESDHHPLFWGAQNLTFWPRGDVFFSREQTLSEVRVWDATDKREVGRLRGLRIVSSEATSALAVSLDGAVVAAAGDKEIMLWQAPVGPHIATVAQTATDLAFFGPTREWLVGVHENSITIWRYGDGQWRQHAAKAVESRLRKSESVSTYSLSVAPSSDGDPLLYAVVAKRTGITKKIPHGTGQTLFLKTWRLPSLEEGPLTIENVRRALLSPDGRYLAVIRSHRRDPRDDVGRIEILEPGSGLLLATLRAATPLSASTLAFSRDSRVLMVGHYGEMDARVSVWDVQAGAPLTVLLPITSGRRWPGPVVMAFSHNHKSMVMGGVGMPLNMAATAWPTVRQQRAADQVREARDLLRLGFAEPGLEKLKAIIDENPYHNPFIENDLLYGELARELSPRYLGELLLHHARKVLALETSQDLVASYTRAIMLYRQFGALAARSGHPQIAAATLAHVRELVESDSPRALLRDLNRKFALMLETQLKVVTEGSDAAYLHLLQQDGWIVDGKNWIVGDIINNPDLWAPLYQDRAKLAYFLQTDEAALPRPSMAPGLAQPYPDLTGTVIEADASPSPPVGRDTATPQPVATPPQAKGRVLD